MKKNFVSVPQMTAAGHSLSSLRAQPKVLANADVRGTHGRNQSENVVRVCCPLVQHMSTRPIILIGSHLVSG